MNLVVLQGNLTHDPEVRYITSNGKETAVCNFSIATHRHYRKANGEKHKETTFIDCEAWDSGAETISKYVKKGSFFVLKGSLKNDTWEKDGKRMSKIKVRVEEFELPPKNNTSSNSISESTPEPQKATTNGDDIPF